MAINIKNTNYSGEVLERLLTVAATGNELVEKGLIHVEPGVSDKFSIPRLKTGKMLQKRKEQPEDSDSTSPVAIPRTERKTTLSPTSSSDAAHGTNSSKAYPSSSSSMNSGEAPRNIDTACLYL